jgi:hypothetical protein
MLASIFMSARTATGKCDPNPGTVVSFVPMARSSVRRFSCRHPAAAALPRRESRERCRAIRALEPLLGALTRRTPLRRSACFVRRRSWCIPACKSG